MPIFLFEYFGGNIIKDLKINDEIRDNKLRLIDEDGSQIGVVSKDEALDKAYDRQLDLVLMSPNAKPPVARIMDYGKFKYDQEKKAKENKKKTKNNSNKRNKI